MKCHLCSEPIEPGEVTRNGVNFVAHKECMLREVLGGIGHFIDHQYFCVEMGDPDAGLPKRLSALLVTTWIDYNGIDATAQKSSEVGP